MKLFRSHRSHQPVVPSIGHLHDEDWTGRTQAALQFYTTASGLSPEQKLEHTMAMFLKAVEDFDQDGLVIGGYCLMRDSRALSRGEDVGSGMERLLPIMDRVVSKRESRGGMQDYRSQSTAP